MCGFLVMTKCCTKSIYNLDYKVTRLRII
ncbi:hypothetical protein KGM_211260 [Danaus plexippus plexippus]|uniref:Uncharacterized protein n=1 Tax=Danaus plexippus plexippus TaxID=278856 RepID=A0A212FPU0_DANPL|nr:hypothetical protein KGM_211260 [Danaus plexippus plexippus]